MGVRLLAIDLVAGRTIATDFFHCLVDHYENENVEQQSSIETYQQDILIVHHIRVEVGESSVVSENLNDS